MAFSAGPALLSSGRLSLSRGAAGRRDGLAAEVRRSRGGAVACKNRRQAIFLRLACGTRGVTLVT